MQLPEELVGVNESNDIFVILKELVKLCKKPSYKKPNTKSQKCFEDFHEVFLFFNFILTCKSSLKIILFTSFYIVHSAHLLLLNFKLFFVAIAKLGAGKT